MEETKVPQKSVTLLLADFRRSLVTLVNESGLPISLVFTIVHELNNELEKVAQDQYERELEAYNAELKKGDK